jgi:hypothetical protein
VQLTTPTVHLTAHPARHAFGNEKQLPATLHVCGVHRLQGEPDSHSSYESGPVQWTVPTVQGFAQPFLHTLMSPKQLPATRHVCKVHF